MTHATCSPTGRASQPVFNNPLAVAVVSAGSGQAPHSYAATSLTAARKAPRSQADFLK